jgi:hypothetical protein
MDSSDSQSVDSLGRRTAPRRHYTLSQKREIVEATLAAGASVASVSHPAQGGTTRFIDRLPTIASTRFGLDSYRPSNVLGAHAPNLARKASRCTDDSAITSIPPSYG